MKMTSTFIKDIGPLLNLKRWDALADRLAIENVVSKASGKVFNDIVEIFFFACTRKDLPLHVLDAFLEVCPEAVRQVYIGCLPIHRALDYNLSVDIINRLIEKYPEGLTCPNDFRVFPLHFAAKHYSVEIVNRCIDAYPDAVRQPDASGQYPIHHAVIFCKSLEVVNRVIAAHPESVQKRDGMGDLPIHIAACTCSSAATKIINRLIEAYPEGAKQRDRHGRLPIHIAAYFQKSVDVVQMLIDAYPIGIVLTYRHISSYLLPSEYARIGDPSNHSHEVISYLENEEEKGLVDLAQTIVERKNGDGQ